MSRLLAVPLVFGRSVQDVALIARRHRRSLAVIWGSVVILGGLAALLTPSVYRCEGRLLVRLGRENAVLDPTATIGQGPVSVVSTSREGEINSIVEILKGRALLETVAERLTPQAVLSDRTSLTDGWLGGAVDADRGAAARKLERMMEAAAVRKSNLVAVTCDAHDPALARQAVGTLLDLFLDQHQGIYRNPGARGFFAQQTEQLGKQLAETEAELLRLKNESGVGSIAEQRRLLLNQISALEDDLVRTETQLRAGEAEVRAIQEKLASLPRITMTQQTTGLPNPAADSMRQQLYDLQLKERELSASLTDEHPLVKQVREQLAGARRILEQEQVQRVQTTQSRDRAHEQLEVTLVTQQTSLESLRARSAALGPAIEQARARLAALNTAETQVARLERQRDLQQANFLKHSQGLEQTQIDAALESERISNISVVQPPLVDSRPVKPNRPLILVMSLVLATLASCGAAVVLEYLEQGPGSLGGHSPLENAAWREAPLSA